MSENNININEQNAQNVQNANYDKRDISLLAAMLRGSTGKSAEQIAWAFHARTGRAMNPAAVPEYVAQAGGRVVGQTYSASHGGFVPTYAVPDARATASRVELAQRIMSQHGIAEPTPIYTCTMADCPALDDELIAGHMRTNSIGIISAAPKSGKSVLMIELAVACTAGARFGTWLGMHVAQTPVLYVDMELKPAEFRNRVERVKSALGIDYALPTFRYLSLRGRNTTLTDLVPVIETMVDEIRDTEGIQIGLIIIDPLYRIIAGDENSNADVTAAYAQISALNEQTGASIMLVHHYAKGSAALRGVLDRAVGAGVFTRAPDYIGTLSALNMDSLTPPVEGATAWRLESVCRSFAPPAPTDCWYAYPVHTAITDGSTDGVLLDGVQETDPAGVAKTAETRGKIFALAADSIMRMMIDSARVHADKKDPALYGITLSDFETEWLDHTGQRIGDTVATRYVKATGREKVGSMQKTNATLYAYKNAPIVRTAYGYREDDGGRAKQDAESAERRADVTRTIEANGGPRPNLSHGNFYHDPTEAEPIEPNEDWLREAAGYEH